MQPSDIYGILWSCVCITLDSLIVIFHVFMIQFWFFFSLWSFFCTYRHAIESLLKWGSSKHSKSPYGNSFTSSTLSSWDTEKNHVSWDLEFTLLCVKSWLNKTTTSLVSHIPSFPTLRMRKNYTAQACTPSIVRNGSVEKFTGALFMIGCLRITVENISKG